MIEVTAEDRLANQPLYRKCVGCNEGFFQMARFRALADSGRFMSEIYDREANLYETPHVLARVAPMIVKQLGTSRWGNFLSLAWGLNMTGAVANYEYCGQDCSKLVDMFEALTGGVE